MLVTRFSLNALYFALMVLLFSLPNLKDLNSRANNILSCIECSGETYPNSRSSSGPNMSLCLLIVKAGTPILGNDELGKNLALVEKVAFNTGLPPEAIAVMLEFAMSLRMGKTVSAVSVN